MESQKFGKQQLKERIKASTTQNEPKNGSRMD